MVNTFVIPCIHARVHASRNPLDYMHFEMCAKMQCYRSEIYRHFHLVGCEPTDATLDNFVASVMFESEVYCADPFSMMAVVAFLHEWEIPWTLVIAPRHLCDWIPDAVHSTAKSAVSAPFTSGNVRYFEPKRCTAMSRSLFHGRWVERRSHPYHGAITLALIGLLLHIVKG